MTLHPNPVSTSAVFEIVLGNAVHAEGAASAEITIYDAGGREVRSLSPSETGTGVHQVSWDVTDRSGRQLSPGVYFYRVQVGQIERRGGIVVMR
ncbi:MAG: FlgD immunoglobulin-like domain containing protein [Candidatus Eisenbacteria bacterium]